MPRGDGSPSTAVVTTAMLAGAVRLPYPLLTRTNYAAWAMRMKYLLRANDAWGAVVRESSSEDVDESKDQLALSIISQSIDDETLLRVAEKETEFDVWTVLRSMHVGAEHVREARIESLRLDFDNLKMDDAESVDEFAAKFTTLVGRIRELGDVMEEKYVVKKLLRVVSNKFINVASSMTLFGDINKMAMEEAIGSLKAHEELLKGREDQAEEQLLMTRRHDSSRGRGCDRDNDEWRKDKSKVQCCNCEEYGHFVWECPKKEKEEKGLLAQGYASDEPALL